MVFVVKPQMHHVKIKAPQEKAYQYNQECMNVPGTTFYTGEWS